MARASPARDEHLLGEKEVHFLSLADGSSISSVVRRWFPVSGPARGERRYPRSKAAAAVDHRVTSRWLRTIRLPLEKTTSRRAPAIRAIFPAQTPAAFTMKRHSI
jgi:hypothetical protein